MPFDATSSTSCPDRDPKCFSALTAARHKHCHLDLFIAFGANDASPIGLSKWDSGSSYSRINIIAAATVIQWYSSHDRPTSSTEISRRYSFKSEDAEAFFVDQKVRHYLPKDSRTFGLVIWSPVFHLFCQFSSHYCSFQNNFCLWRSRTAHFYIKTYFV